MRFAVDRLDHLALNVRDVEIAAAWYQRVLGMEVETYGREHRTALKFGEIVAREMGQTDHVHGREGQTGQRPRTEIGYHAVRVGDNVGEHTIIFGMLGETLEVVVRGQSRDSYALGALTAAKFLVTQSAGLYTMNDALGL